MTRVVLARLDPGRVCVGDVMTRDPVCVEVDVSPEEAMALITSRRIRHLPVVDGRLVVGLVSIGDLVRWTLRDRQYAIEQLQDYVTGKYPGWDRPYGRTASSMLLPVRVSSCRKRAGRRVAWRVPTRRKCVTTRSDPDSEGGDVIEPDDRALPRTFRRSDLRRRATRAASGDGAAGLEARRRPHRDGRCARHARSLPPVGLLPRRARGRIRRRRPRAESPGREGREPVPVRTTPAPDAAASASAPRRGNPPRGAMVLPHRTPAPSSEWSRFPFPREHGAFQRRWVRHGSCSSVRAS